MAISENTKGPDGGNGQDGRFSDNIIFFARTLRHAGIPVGPAAVIDAIRAVETAGVSSRSDFYWTLHAVFVKKREHRPVFHEAFELFWQERGLIDKLLAILSPVAPAEAPAEKPKAGQTRAQQAINRGLERKQEIEKPELEIDAKLTISSREVLQTKDFAQMTAEEIAVAKMALRDLRFPADRMETRRLVAANRGRFDPRRALRASLRVGGDIIVPKFRRRAQIQPPLVALCDISGSMSQYSRMMLHFLHAVTEQRRRVHTFLFGTRLTNVTRQLRLRDPDEALAGCSEIVLDWSGGTRIASALHAFNRNWSRRVLGQGATVLLITDGLERDGDVDLAHEIDRLHRSCRKLIWLNPLLRFDGFEARAFGIRTMLPHVDSFRSIHSLESISDLVNALSGDDGNLRSDPKRFLEAA